ncbi:beta-1,3-galactosyltransferase 5-like [Parasteatoda tepidariorum]|uniref:beta-1,3-galactosyltransferase 5-like n=1 Tax=Parasteatoda tepidariorum TaxID=114398 RepID=UPI00077FCA79|nr:beta-1,3-galactosyltransferase 5-like [Parasteatoda tepidariorum]XP_015912907.1 beta-1,3-galactosyltransferase 5-like [Parasteatoda tepidariorum]
MKGSSLFRWKKILIYICFLSTTFLLVSLISLLQKVEEDDLPFDQKDLNERRNSNNFLNLEDAFKQPVPDVTRLRYYQNSAKPCNSRTPTLLVFVHSAPAHFLHRNSIRSTWGSFSNDLSIRTVFVIGHSTQNLVWQRIIHEAQSHGDIILVDMPDSYNNLTLKHLVGLHWSLKNCPDVPFIMKTDDDVFVDMYRLEKTILLNLPLNAVACRVVPAGTVPKRSGKWKVNRNEYPFDDYPEYCSGLAYVSRSSTLKRILKSAVSGQVPYLWIDDVFITGFSAEHAGVKRRDLSVWFARTDEQVLNWLSNDGIVNPLPWIIAEISPRYWPFNATAIWNKTIKTHENKHI